MNVNVLQSVNSFMGQFGLTVSSPKQILAKVTTVALAAILLSDKLSLAAACKDPVGLQNCVSNCALTDSACNQACFSKYC
ncbi:MAG: hypothetical protein ACRCU0_02900 [Candidatus Rhabdochlamydia sp.]